MAAPKNPKPGKGKKSVSWRDDPEILRRLDAVEDLILSGYRNSEIVAYFKGENGKATGFGEVSEATVRRDRERIMILLRDRTAGSIIDKRARSVANLRRIQRYADNDYRRAKDELAPLKPNYLRLQLEAEREIAKLEGTQTPVDQNVNVHDVDKPIEALSTTDMLKRAAALEALAKKLLGEQEAEEEECADDNGDPHSEAKDLGE